MPHPKRAKTYTRIVMFDFDGTLFRSWEKTPEWWPDPRPYSFFMRPESMGEPCVPERPGPQYWIRGAVAEARESGARRDTLTIIVTGRVKAHEPRIRELLTQAGIRVERMFFNPGMNAATFKTRVLGMLLASNPVIDEIHIWENENMGTYAKYLQTTKIALGRDDVEVEVHTVEEHPVPLVCTPSDFGMSEARVASRWLSTVAPFSRKRAMSSDKSTVLMKFLSGVAKRHGVGDHVYVVGGAPRNHLMGLPIKDLDVTIDVVALGPTRDSAWFAAQVAREIPTSTSLVTNNYGVAILTVKGPWFMGGEDLSGEVIEIANTRKESYGAGDGPLKGKGYKPTDVQPATIREDLHRREFSFNTLLWRLSDLTHGPEHAEVLDMLGVGKQHLEDREMHTPGDPDRTFRDDPTRMLRAVRFCVKYGFKMTPEVERSIQRNAHLLAGMPWESVGTLVTSILDL